MKGLSEVVLRFFDLIEAEGRALKQGAVSVAFAAALFSIAGVMAVAGLFVLLAAVFMTLSPLMGRVGACYATAGLMLCTSCLVFLGGFRFAASSGERGGDKHGEPQPGAAEADSGGGQEKLGRGDGTGQPRAGD